MAEKTVTLDDQDWLVVDAALQRMPYGQVAGLFERINAQFSAQMEKDLSDDDVAARRVLRADA
jgi:hypothetical protein